jgi:hypothetical protein
MQICHYNSVKYFARIKLHFYNLVTILWAIFFNIFFFQQWEGFLQILLYTIDESVKMSFFFFLNLKFKGVC